MAHAWLDSLSEDWVSQPRSEDSVAQLQLPSSPKEHEDHFKQSQGFTSRIPRRSIGARSSSGTSIDDDLSVLSERMANDINSMRRLPSKLQQELKASQSDTDSRCVSGVSNGSVIHNTIQQNSSSFRLTGHTPEWKRRLVKGDMQYGEQRDLFCSAAAGLQDMFKPPTPNALPEIAQHDFAQHETTIGSSPPMQHRRSSIDLAEEVDNFDEDEHELPDEVTPSPSPRRTRREVQYKLNVEGPSMTDTPPSMRSGQRACSQFTPDIYLDESCLSTAAENAGNIRKVSSQTDTNNEEFSEIVIRRQNFGLGHVGFAPIDFPADQLKAKLEHLRVNQSRFDPKGSSQVAFTSNDSVAENLENTDDYAQQGGFLNFRRGGRSAEGSFRHRELSQDLAESSEMLPDESLQASTPKHYGSVNKDFGQDIIGHVDTSVSPLVPPVPLTSPDKRQDREINARVATSGGSPLKLFGPYDTFTNQTLLHRISQFEEARSDSPSQLQASVIIEREEEEMDDQSLYGEFADLGPIRINELRGPVAGSRRSRSPSMNEFGGGDLEGFEFDGDMPPRGDAGSRFTENNKENISPPRLPPIRPAFFETQHESSPEPESGIYIHRRRDRSVSSNKSKGMRVLSGSSLLRKSMGQAALGAPQNFGTQKRDVDSESKRPRTSPAKDPTPKRRRTLHKSDIAFGRDCLAGIDVASPHDQLTTNKKRGDVKLSSFDLASPHILAKRPILRPRTPSARFTYKQHDESQCDNSLTDRPRSAPTGSQADDSLSNYQEGLAVTETETGRKPSIRTQDFVDQAAQIMAMIRNQVKPGLASVEESGLENEPSLPMSDSLGTESTSEPFSRPPSREGKIAVSRMPHQQDDPELVDRLKKYQELSDMGDIISSSIRSMNLAKDAIRQAQEVERHISGSNKTWSRSRSMLMASGQHEEIISDLSNVRISTNPAQNSQPSSPQRDFHSDSAGMSSSASYPTVSSRASDTRRTIMPESVSHLIPDRVGSMCLDKNNNIWIKSKEAAMTNVPPSDSEDDPFASIPDLSVDMTKELQNLRLNGSGKLSVAETIEGFEATTSSTSSVTIQPRRRYGLSPDEQSSQQANTNTLVGEESDVEEAEETFRSADDPPELDASAIKVTNAAAEQKRRNITISFSSPVASFIHEMKGEDIGSPEDERKIDPASEMYSTSGKGTFERPSPGKPALRNVTGSVRGGSVRLPTRNSVPRETNFFPRPVSRIDEQDEDSTVELPHVEQQQHVNLIADTSLVSHKTPDQSRCASLSFIMNRTPGSRVLSLRGNDNSMIGKNVGKLSLSPLSEFTLNNGDQSFGFELSYVMGRRHMETGNGNKKVLSMTIRDLVDKLSEVEPFEPYWEDITELDLQGKRLSSLHMLDEFCGKIVTLDASNNSLGHLEGIPCSVRQLKVADNMLTELTSWEHLNNLQYVDISGNEVKSLSALKGLVHLRSIRADNNELTSLDGLDCHDGLLSLRARNNKIAELDFATLRLDRLTELDLCGNEIESIDNIELLPALSKLFLSKNRLGKWSTNDCVSSLAQLDVSDNELTILNVSNLPNLHSLHADRNMIVSLHGFTKTRRLDSLSLREQQGETPLDMTFLSSAYEIRKLFLSGNYLGTFNPRVDFLNLQLLELANCGLQALPENMGQLMPNLRTLNVNFNAIANLSPLKFIPRLKKLLAVGNRLADSTTVTELLTDFPHLTRLDLRDNPVTLGFYAPIQVLVSTKETICIDPFTLPDGDKERDETFCRRLDEATKMRRRLHQISFVASCKRLKTLDGLPLNRRSVFARDEVLERLVHDGLLPALYYDATGPGKETGSERSDKAPTKVSE